jgi:hypothetical protein
MIHFITYGDDNFTNSKKRIYSEALNCGWFDTITIYGPQDLDSDFKEQFKDILKFERGGGYWIWKGYIIKKKLSEINDGDILVYADCGCTVNKNGKKRFYEYIEMLNKSNVGIISFKMSHPEKYYTTKEIFEYFNVSPESDIANSGQIVGGIRIMKKVPKLVNMIDTELQTYKEKPLLVTDYYNSEQEEYFKDNRHEQSIFSVIRKLNNPILLHDETYGKNFKNIKMLRYPFLATRIRG